MKKLIPQFDFSQEKDVNSKIEISNIMAINESPDLFRTLKTCTKNNSNQTKTLMDFAVNKKESNITLEEIKCQLENKEIIEDKSISQYTTEKTKILKIKEISGDLFPSKEFEIGTEGLLKGSLRNEKDGIVYFGKEDNKLTDYVLSIPEENTENIPPIIFKIFYNKNDSSFYLSTDSPGVSADFIMFFKIDKPMKIDKKYLISLGESHFSVDISDEKLQTLQIDLTSEMDGSKRFVFNKNNNKITIGRGKKCDIILHQLSYSRVQTSFVFNNEENCWYMYDGNLGKGSTNGTWIFLNWPLKIENNLIFRVGQSLLGVNLIEE
ncbi:MAG: FHA domain-containing protein [archaeon]|nr:FHA domain-containing protein [archaeon]